MIPFCEKHGIAVVAYSRFGSVRFPRPRSRGGRVLAEIANDHGASPHQVALAFLLRCPSLFVIPKASQAEHALENAEVADLMLSDEEIRRIEQAFPQGRRRRGVPFL